MKFRLLLLFLIIFGKALGQSNKVNQYPGIYYQRGLELYDEKKYNAAIAQFSLFLESQSDPGQKSEAQYYLAVSKLYASHSDGEASLQRFIANNPGSHKTHMANLALGDFYYMRQKYSQALGYYKTVDVTAIGQDQADRFAFRKGYSQVATRKYKDAAETLYPLTNKETEYRTLATYYYAYCAYYTGKYDEALRAFRAIEVDGPKYVRLYIAQIYYLQNQYEKAIAAASKITSGVPMNRVNFLKGKCYYRLGQYEQAADAYNQSGMTLDSLDKNEIYEFGYANYKTGKHSKAIEWFKSVAFQGDSLAQFASYNMADCFMKLKSKREAMNAFGEAYRTGFNKAVAEDALFNQSKLAVELSEPNAASLIQKFIDNYPASPKTKEVKKILAGLLLSTDNYRDAVSVLESIGEMDAQTEEVYQKVTLARGMELFRARQWNEAKSMFDKCISKDNKNALAGQSYYWKAEILAQESKYAESVSNYQKFIDAPGTSDLDYHPYAYYGLAYARYKEERYTEAITYFEKFVKNLSKGKYDDKFYNDAQLRLGDCNYAAAGLLGKEQNNQKKNNLDDAISAYAFVTSKRGADADYALYQTGMIYGLQGQLFDISGMREKKITAMKRLVSDFARSRFIPDAYFELGSEFWAAGNTREAEKYYMFVIDDYKGNPMVMRCYLNLGRIYNNAGQSEKAIDMYTHLYDEFPGTPEAGTASENVKRIYADQGKASEYVKWSKNRGGMSASAKDTLLYTTAFNLYERDKYNEAVRSFEEYLTEMTNGAFVTPSHYYKAICHEELKQKDNAIKHYKVVADANGSEFQEDAVLSLLRLYGPNAPCEELVIYLDKIEKITKNRETRYKAWKALLTCYDKLARYNEAKDIANRISSELSIDEEMKAEAAVYLGKADFRDKNYEGALQRFKDAHGKYNNQYGAEAKYREGLTLFTMGQYDECKKSCYEMMDKFNSYDFWLGKSMLLLGDAFIKKGDEFSAKATWNSVVENFEIAEIVNEAKEKLATLKNKKVGSNLIED